MVDRAYRLEVPIKKMGIEEGHMRKRTVATVATYPHLNLVFTLCLVEGIFGGVI